MEKLQNVYQLKHHTPLLQLCGYSLDRYRYTHRLDRKQIWIATKTKRRQHHSATNFETGLRLRPTKLKAKLSKKLNRHTQA